MVYITNKDWKLLGVVSLRNLVINKPDVIVGSILKQPAMSVLALDNQEKAYKVSQKYDLSVLPVVDSNEIMVDIGTADDVFDIVEEEITEDFQKSEAVGTFTENFLHISIFSYLEKEFAG